MNEWDEENIFCICLGYMFVYRCKDIIATYEIFALVVLR